MRHATLEPLEATTMYAQRLGTALVLALTIAGASTAAAQVPDEIIRGYGSPAVVAVRQDSLLEIALNSRDPTARAAAIRGIASPGRAWYFIHGAEAGPALVHYPGTVARLERIYRTMGSWERETVVTSLAHQAERAEAVGLLSEVARSRGMGLDLPLAPMAVDALSRMGGQGAAALHALHSTHSDSLPLIRRQLEELSRTGYRRPAGG